ncbi:MAG TPA: RNA-binding protein [Thermoanaerobaculia bacterium]|nr:RNA-binding protein [Thermoanaerobaculia bacterium]
MKLYVGNLSKTTNDAQLNEMMSAFGKTESVAVVTDRDTGESRGFGFVEMPNDAEANAAMAALHGKEVDGRALKVNEAKSKGPTPART